MTSQFQVAVIFWLETYDVISIPLVWSRIGNCIKVCAPDQLVNAINCILLKWCYKCTCGKYMIFYTFLFMVGTLKTDFSRISTRKSVQKRARYFQKTLRRTLYPLEFFFLSPGFKLVRKAENFWKWGKPQFF